MPYLLILFGIIIMIKGRYYGRSRDYYVEGVAARFLGVAFVLAGLAPLALDLASRLAPAPLSGELTGAVFPSLFCASMILFALIIVFFMLFAKKVERPFYPIAVSVVAGWVGLVAGNVVGFYLNLPTVLQSTPQQVCLFFWAMASATIVTAWIGRGAVTRLVGQFGGGMFIGFWLGYAGSLVAAKLLSLL